jgi:hypothetical protein
MEVALLLVQRGAPTLVRNAQGQTPLDVAATEGLRAALLAEAARGRRCAACGAGAAACKLKKCAGCQAVLYCSPDCQQADWREHRRTCRLQRQPVCTPANPRARACTALIIANFIYHWAVYDSHLRLPHVPVIPVSNPC